MVLGKGERGSGVRYGGRGKGDGCWVRGSGVRDGGRRGCWVRGEWCWVRGDGGGVR